MPWWGLQLIAFTATVLIISCVTSICAFATVREKWREWFSSRRSNQQRASGSSPPPPSPPPPPREEETERFHYVISAEQENEIRESFLQDRLCKFTKSLAEDDIKMKNGCTYVVSGTMRRPSMKEGLVHCLKVNGGGSTRSLGTKLSGAGETADDLEDGTEDCCTVVSDTDHAKEAGFVIVPLAGEPCLDGKDTLTSSCSSVVRMVPNGCAICISPFDPEDRVTWSSNKRCNHIFHYHCILDWLKTTGSRHCQRRGRRDQLENAVLNYANNPLLKITRFPMQCPSCRQDFIVSESDDVSEQKLVSEPEELPSTSSETSTDSSSSEHSGPASIVDCDEDEIAEVTELVEGSDDAIPSSNDAMEPPMAENV